MPQFPITPNTLDHVLALEAGGHKVSDVSLTKMLPTLYRLRLTLHDGSFREFYHESATGDDIERLQAQIAAHITAYGPHTLLESIHREVLQRSRSEGCSPAEFTVLLSNDLFRAATPHLPGYRSYGYTFRVATGESGSWYRVHRVSNNNEA
jgi:hypothetical protein